MKTITKQIVVNVILIIISITVSVISQSVIANEWLGLFEYINDDFVLLLMTSLGTTIGWRFAENIRIHWIYNIFVGMELFLLTCLYGISIAIINDIVVWFIVVASILFFLLYIVENVFIVLTFKKRQKRENLNNIGYNR